MKLILPYHANINIEPNSQGVTLEIEDSQDKLIPNIYEDIFNERGSDHLARTMPDNVLFELLDEREEDLHEYLEKKGIKQ